MIGFPGGGLAVSIVQLLGQATIFGPETAPEAPLSQRGVAGDIDINGESDPGSASGRQDDREAWFLQGCIRTVGDMD